MSTKLTLRLDERLIEQAKLYAMQQRASVSQLVADYFRQLKVTPQTPLVQETNAQPYQRELAPVTQRLRGILAETGEADERQIYRDHLAEKHR